jgi:hypothetical protein
MSDSNQNDEVFSAENIAKQTEEFIKKGGKIQQIPIGVSGQVQTSGPRHITLGTRDPKKQELKERRGMVNLKLSKSAEEKAGVERLKKKRPTQRRKIKQESY